MVDEAACTVVAAAGVVFDGPGLAKKLNLMGAAPDVVDGALDGVVLESAGLGATLAVLAGAVVCPNENGLLLAPVADGESVAAGAPTPPRRENNDGPDDETGAVADGFVTGLGCSGLAAPRMLNPLDGGAGAAV